MKAWKRTLDGHCGHWGIQVLPERCFKEEKEQKANAYKFSLLLISNKSLILAGSIVASNKTETSSPTLQLGGPIT